MINRHQIPFKFSYNLPQIAPEAVSEHEYVKNFWGACPQTPLEVFGFLCLSGSATVQPPQTKMSRSVLAGGRQLPPLPPFSYTSAVSVVSSVIPKMICATYCHYTHIPQYYTCEYRVPTSTQSHPAVLLAQVSPILEVVFSLKIGKK